MACNLLANDHALCVWNRSPERLAPILEAGATAADSPADLARRSELVMI